MEQSRWKSPIFWSGIVAQVVGILLFAEVITIAQSDLISKIVAIAFEVWTAFAVANNPTNATGF
jgi:hypothetical protein